ncbi:STAS domain-containing protein [Peribacillus kribbensis]|uniref:STAS domain-containing protein n=1 Tax=Peribacillus kribbensis TaxID=356658 RepID=UPI0003F6BFCD|nr:STAS domain-containing protein [Peribacillus kribbensis]
MVKKSVKVQVESNEFEWNAEEGLFTFDGAPALLFWDSAIELFLKTIEEVSGCDVSKTVFEATGYRMGHLVSSYYEGRSNIEDLLVEYSDIYRNAGWGNVEIAYYSFEEKRALIRLRNSWEHRIFNNTDKENAGVILPSHWAGVFTGLFKQNVWYKVNKSQLKGHEYDEIEIFPSNMTAARNIHQLSRQKEQESIQSLEQKVKERTEELSSLVMELSSPVIPVLEDVLVIPMVGKFNEERMSIMIERSLYELSSQQAQFLLIDVTGLSHFDNYVIYGIQRLIRAVRLLGGECYLVGISAALSIQFTNSNLVDMTGMNTFSTLQKGVEYAIGQIGYEFVKKKGK